MLNILNVQNVQKDLPYGRSITVQCSSTTVQCCSMLFNHRSMLFNAVQPPFNAVQPPFNHRSMLFIQNGNNF
jgi:hypothetical protein